MPPKATAAAGDAAAAETSAQGGEPPVKKKRKASRACQSCQKAHLTCSDTRPCARCTKRGEECIEGEKKKARYLYTPEELEKLPKPAPKGRRSSTSTANPARHSPTKPASENAVSQVGANTGLGLAPTAKPAVTTVHTTRIPAQAPPHSTFQRRDNPHGDLRPLAPAPPSAPHHAALQPSAQSVQPKNITSFGGLGYVWTPPSASQSAQSQQQTNGGAQFTSNGTEALSSDFFASNISPSSEAGRLSHPRSSHLPNQHQPFLDVMRPTSASGSAPPLNQLGLWPELPSDPLQQAHPQSQHGSSHSPYESTSFTAAQLFPDTQPAHLRASYTSPPSVGGSHQSFADGKGKQREMDLLLEQGPSGRGGYWEQGLEKGLRGFALGSNDAYALATRHGRAYRRLISHVKDKFGEADALKVVKSISEFRPKVLSTTAHHTQDDTLFLEFALHRALKDLTSTLLPITGTPTAIWRRTGEILAVGAEFCILTEWSQQDLIFRDTEDIPLAERTMSGLTVNGEQGKDEKDGVEGWKGCFCWELMEKQSVIEFYDNFSRCAFDGTTPSFNLTCTLLTPAGRAISCAACFSIRRDIFDFPSLIIGQFLPLL